MNFSDDGKCHICKRIFCCGKCRQKHLFETHVIAISQPLAQHSALNVDHHNEMTAVRTRTIYVFCPICEQKPLALRDDMYAELLAHIESVHLPLRCRKCLRHYTKIDDLREFSKCVDLGQSCSISGSAQNVSSNTDTSKVTMKKATVAASTISTQTSPSVAKDPNETHHLHLTPISLFNLRWRAKSRLAQEEFISDSVSSIRNLSSDSVNLSTQHRRSIGQLAMPPDTTRGDKGKIIRSTSTPLQVYTVFAKPKETLTFNASTVGGGHMSSIYHSGCGMDEQNTVPSATPDNSQLLQPQQQHRTWKAGGRGKISAVTPLRQVMSKSIQKAFVEHGVSALASQGDQQRMRLNLNEHSTPSGSAPLDLRLSPVVRRTQSEASMACNQETSSEPYQILLSAQKLTTESIIITRTRHGGNSGSLPAAMATGSNTTSTVYNSCESVEIITSSTSTAELSANMQQVTGNCNIVVPPITPITRVPGAIINKKLIKFETPLKHTEPNESKPDEHEIFYTPNPSPRPASQPGSPNTEPNSNERRRQQIMPRQLSGQFSPQAQRPQLPRPQGPRARPPLRVCHNQKSFSCVQDIGSEDDDEVFLPNSASTHNDKKRPAANTKSETGRLWSLMSSVIRFPKALRTDRDDKENTTSTSGSRSLIKRCASIAGSLVRTIHAHDDTDMQTLKRKRTQTLDNPYCHQLSPSNSSKRFRIQPRKPIERMLNN